MLIPRNTEKDEQSEISQDSSEISHQRCRHCGNNLYWSKGIYSCKNKQCHPLEAEERENQYYRIKLLEMFGNMSLPELAKTLNEIQHNAYQLSEACRRLKNELVSPFYKAQAKMFDSFRSIGEDEREAVFSVVNGRLTKRINEILEEVRKDGEKVGPST